MNETPRLVGYEEIPVHLKDYNGLARQIVRHLQAKKALVLEMRTNAGAVAYRKCLINAARSEYGVAACQTAIEGRKIYLWKREDEPDLKLTLEKINRRIYEHEG